MGCYAITLGLLTMVGLMIDAGIAYFIGLILTGGIALYHYTLIKGRQQEACFNAFLHNNWFGAMVFAGIAVDYLVRG